MSNSKLCIVVLIPVDKSFDDIYQLGIQQACQELGIDCQRIAVQYYTDNSLTTIQNQIAEADLLIADLTGKNPHVFFQLGYACGNGRKPLLLAQQVADIPFDLQHYNHIVYDGQINTLRAELTKKLQWCLRNSLVPPLPTQDALTYFLCQKPLPEHPCLIVSPDAIGEFHLTLDYQNTTDQVITENIRFCLVVPDGFASSDNLMTVEIARGTAQMILVGQTEELGPHESHTLMINLYTTGNQIGQEHTLEVQFFSERGIQKYPFTIILA